MRLLISWLSHVTSVIFHLAVSCAVFPSVLWRCWLGDRKGIRPVKSWVLVCWWWWFDWSFARLIAPVVTTTSWSLAPIKLANPGSPGKMAVKTEIVSELCCHCRHGGAGDSIAVGNSLYRTQTHTDAVSVQSKKYHAADLRRFNKAATVIQVWTFSIAYCLCILCN